MLVHYRLLFFKISHGHGIYNFMVQSRLHSLKFTQYIKSEPTALTLITLNYYAQKMQRFFIHTSARIAKLIFIQEQFLDYFCTPAVNNTIISRASNNRVNPTSEF